MARRKTSKTSRKHLHQYQVYVLLFIVLGCFAIGADGYMLYRHYHPAPVPETSVNTKQTKQPSAQPTPTNPYAGWHSYSIPKSKLTFQYPANWQLNPATGPLGPWASPGTPETSLVAPNGLYMDILTDQDNRVSESGNTVLLAQPIQTLGDSYSIDYIDAVGDHNVTYATLLTGSVASSPYPSVAMPDGTTDRLVVSIAYKVKSGPSEEPLSAYQHDATVTQAKLVIASLRDR